MVVAVVAVVAVAVAASSPLFAQQGPEDFHWVDFHSQADQSVIVWVTRALQSEKWTAIREIGVRYDAALVVTTLRSSAQSAPNEDTFAIWSVSLTSHLVTPLLKGVNLRWADWLHYLPGKTEPAILYDNCYDCPADTYLTSFYYDIGHHTWTARWMHGGQGLHLWSASPPPGVEWTQVYAVMAQDNGSESVGTWNHFDYGSHKPAADYVYQYDLDPVSGLERVQQLTGKQAQNMELRLCSGATSVRGLAQGQDSPLCQETVPPNARRQPATTPAGNSGRSFTGGAGK
ncbi:MAG TPA: hypothetical protein VMV57_09840 [Terracidiphilus sp.]|nr:hypothetical protein [Terracidiphilus sp.]